MSIESIRSNNSLDKLLSLEEGRSAKIKFALHALRERAKLVPNTPVQPTSKMDFREKSNGFMIEIH